MPDNKMGLSTQTLVSTQGKARKFPQYVAALSATLGAFALGTLLGWSSPIDDELKQKVGDAKSWVVAMMPVGAAVVVFPIGLMMDAIGRKLTMLLLVIPFTAGWALIIWGEDDVWMLSIGRFITGMAGGAFSLTAPVYTNEIAEKDIRGTLGSYFQLMVTIGILFVYILGSEVKMFPLSLACGVVPLVFGVIFFFMPETPAYRLSKGQPDRARDSLQFFRGKHYNVDAELAEMQAAADAAHADHSSVFAAFSTKPAIKGLAIALGLMSFQQLSGVNAVIFFSSTIFTEAKTAVSGSTGAIILGVMQVVATFISSLVVDRLGRRILLLLSDSVMALCTLMFGVYYTLDSSVQKSISWLPIVAMVLFIIVFSLGYGPIPWMMVSELFPARIRAVASSISCVVNWVFAFLVTRFFDDLQKGLGKNVTFYIFAGVSTLGTLFVFFIVPETKGKTVEEIQRELRGENDAAGS